MSLPTPNLYYSFNIPDKNLYNNIQNWANGYPVYDASLNNAYISRQNYYIGNGSLEMPKNRITTPPIAKSSITKTYTTLSSAVSNDQLRMVLCDYGTSTVATGAVYYRTRANTGVAFPNTDTTVPNSSGSRYYRVAITGDGNRLVTCQHDDGSGTGYVYFSTWTQGAFPALTRTLDNIKRQYYGLSITKDGSRMVVSTNTNIFFTNWNGTNYDSFTQTLVTNPPTLGLWIGIGISYNGDRICYGDNLTSFRLSYWNGSNYNNGVVIRTYTDGITRSAFFNNDASVLFLSFINNTTTSMEIANNMPTAVLPASLDLHGLWCVDTTNNVTIYSAPYANTSLYITDASYITTGGYSYANVNASAIQIGSTPGTSGLTFAVWFRSNYNITYSRIFDFANGAQDNIVIGILNNHVYFATQNGVNVSLVDFINYNINDNIWYHLVITLACSNTTTAINTCTAYINGGGTINTNQFSNSTYYYPRVINRANNYLGRSNFSENPQFFGNIDDFRVYPRVLTDSEVNQIYNTRGVTNNYRNSTVYRLYNVPVETANYDLTIATPTMGSNQTYFYWNDPNAGAKSATPNGRAIVNKSNPYNFKYTYNNTVPYSQVNVTFVCDDFVTLKVNGSTIVNNGRWATVYTQNAIPINSGNNLFEFLCYNTGGPAVFAAYVVSSNNSTYLFSTNFTTSGWSVDISGFFSNGYPTSALLMNESSGAKTNIGTTFFQSQNLDLSNNQSSKNIPASNIFFRTNNVDFKDLFSNY